MSVDDGGKPPGEGVLQIILAIALLIAVAAWLVDAFKDPTVSQSPSPAPSVTAVAR